MNRRERGMRLALLVYKATPTPSVLLRRSGGSGVMHAKFGITGGVLEGAMT